MISIDLQEWTSHLGFPVKTSWHPWFGDAAAGGSRVAAGYAVQYDKPARDFQFVTVKGAGHEVRSEPVIGVPCQTCLMGSAGEVGGAVRIVCGIPLITILKRGVQVPTFKPQAAYTLFTSFINGTAL